MKTKSTNEWGKATAKERYSAKPDSASAGDSANKGAIIGLINQPELDETGRVMQAPQAVNDKHGPGYDSDASGWVRGVGGGEAKPGFDKSKGRR